MSSLGSIFSKKSGYVWRILKVTQKEQHFVTEIYGKHYLILPNIHAKLLWEAVN